MQTTGEGCCRRAGTASHGTKGAKGDTPRIDVACQLIEVPVKAPGDRPTVLTDGALQMTGYQDASGVSSIGCPVLLSTGTDRRWCQANAWLSQPTGQRACAARACQHPCGGLVSMPSAREQDAQDSSSGSRADGSHRFVSGEGGCRLGMMWFAPRERWARADRDNRAITTAGDRAPEAALDAAERRFSVSRCPEKLIERDAPPDTGEVRSEVTSLVDATSVCGDRVEKKY